MGSPGSSSDPVTNCIPAAKRHSTPKSSTFSDSGYLSATPIDSPSCSSNEYLNSKVHVGYKLVDSIIAAGTFVTLESPVTPNRRLWRPHPKSSVSSIEKTRQLDNIFSEFTSKELCIWDKADRDLQQAHDEKTRNDAVASGDGIPLKQHVDFIKELVCQRSMYHVVCKIFGYLSPKDLCAVACVSRVWREACLKDGMANQQRLKFLEEAERFKENIGTLIEKAFQIKQKKLPESILGQICINTKTIDDSLPSCSQSSKEPSTHGETRTLQMNTRYHDFVKEAACLEKGGELRHCPRCYSPSRVNKKNHTAKCQRLFCSFEFCILCHQSYHHPLPCHKPMLDDSMALKQIPAVGSKQSKKNLKRM